MKRFVKLYKVCTEDECPDQMSSSWGEHSASMLAAPATSSTACIAICHGMPVGKTSSSITASGTVTASIANQDETRLHILSMPSR